MVVKADFFFFFLLPPPRGCRWDEMGQYDLPASLDYVLRVTQQPTLIYVGHSLGCGIFFIAMNEHPHLNARVEVMVALAPASSLANLKRFRPLVPFFNPFQVTRWYHYV